MISILVLIAGFSISSPTPDACLISSKADSGYQTGFKTGRLLANQAWLRLGSDCSRRDEAANAISSTLGVISSSLTNSTYSQCRFSGITDGLAAFIDEIFVECPINGAACEQEGEELGALYAQAYCELAIMLGGAQDPGEFLRPPVSDCGDLFQNNCDTAFLTTAPAYVSADSSSCLPFTVLPFASAYHNTRGLVCSYNVPVAQAP